MPHSGKGFLAFPLASVRSYQLLAENFQALYTSLSLLKLGFRIVGLQFYVYMALPVPANGIHSQKRELTPINSPTVQFITGLLLGYC